MPKIDEGFRLQAIMLCDHANVREGMLSVLSAGISRAGLQAYPGSLPAYLALLIYIPPDRVELAHECDVKLKYPDTASEIAAINIAFHSQAKVFNGEGITIPLALPVHPIVFTRHGQVDVQVSVNNHHVGELSFWLLPPGTDPRTPELS